MSMRNIYWQNLVVLMVGVWLCFSPWTFAYLIRGLAQFDIANWNLLISGAVIVILSAMALVTSQRWEVWLEMLISGWLVMSPWLLGFQLQPFETLNLLLSGGILFIMTIWTLSRSRHAREW
jgi:hypothetical protein